MKNYNYGGRSFAAGGAMPMEQLTEFNEGGRHEENSLGGIPQGMNPEGQMNLVEEGETKFDAENYIYSDSLKVDKELAEAFNLAPSMVGKTFADASKMAGRKKSKRQGDAIETAANEKDLSNLMEAQEAFKQARIEEKLQEIAELDPNALPALMGQGQPQEGAPQGDPAMGGQMQEAPMDEQAMMEQQMMAEQQGGGGQPSPEEMAMMEQQQNQMMGQQEGMMRAGGKLPKEVLKARVQSHMSPAQANAYVKNYGNGGYTRSYASGGKMDFEPHMMYKDGNGIQANAYQKHLSLKNEGYGHSMGYGGYTKKRSYGPGGTLDEILGDEDLNSDLVNKPGYEKVATNKGMFPRVERTKENYQGMTDNQYFNKFLPSFQNLQEELRARDMIENGYDKYAPPSLYASGGFMGANPGMMNIANPEPCGGPGNPCPDNTNYANIDFSSLNSEESSVAKSKDFREDPRAFKGQVPFSIVRQQRKANKGLMDSRIGAYGIPVVGTKPFNWKKNARVHNDETNLNQSTDNVNSNGSFPNSATHDFTKVGKFLNNIQPWNWTDDRMVRSNPTRFAGKGERVEQQFGGSLNQTQPQGMNQMGSGGKMCYGCGGKMHAYGGRMDGIQHKYGAGMKTAGTVLDTVADFAKFIPVVGQVVAPIAEAGANVLQGAGEAKATDTAYSLKESLFDAGSGAAGTFVPGAEQAIQAAGDMATKKEKTAEMQKKQEILNDPSHPDHEQVKKAMEDRSTDKSLQNAETFGNVWNKTAGMASKLISPGEKGLEGASEVADFAPDGVTENVTDTVGQLGDSMPIGNWADIDTENMPEMPENMATGGRMYAGGGYMGTRSYGKGGGLWANIHDKRKRGEAPAKPGDKNYPTAKAIRASQNAMGGRLFSPGGYMSPMFAGPELNNLDLDDDGSFGGDMNNAFIDMSMSANPTDLISPAYNLGMGLFGKDADTSYDIEQYTSKPFDFTQTKNALRRQTAKATNQLGRKGTGNPSNLLALSQIGSKLEADYLQKAQNVNIQREQAAMDKNTKGKNAYEKEQKQLELKEKAVRDELIKAGLKDIRGISDKNAQTEYMFKFMQSMAPDVVRGSYTNMSQMFMEMLKKK